MMADARPGFEISLDSDWRRSSYSNENNDCVEVRTPPHWQKSRCGTQRTPMVM